jgi:hypothetical protein
MQLAYFALQRRFNFIEFCPTSSGARQDSNVGSALVGKASCGDVIKLQAGKSLYQSSGVGQFNVLFTSVYQSWICFWGIFSITLKYLLEIHWRCNDSMAYDFPLRWVRK